MKLMTTYKVNMPSENTLRDTDRLSAMKSALESKSPLKGSALCSAGEAGPEDDVENRDGDGEPDDPLARLQQALHRVWALLLKARFLIVDQVDLLQLVPAQARGLINYGVHGA